ncbi:hypothetical protein Bbelb_097340 [Branchiostoma belcheri]|nr:hypothetical protein Bbelb_097340 [Branchiostoma belcheri]
MIRPVIAISSTSALRLPASGRVSRPKQLRHPSLPNIASQSYARYHGDASGSDQSGACVAHSYLVWSTCFVLGSPVLTRVVLRVTCGVRPSYQTQRIRKIALLDLLQVAEVLERFLGTGPVFFNAGLQAAVGGTCVVGWAGVRGATPRGCRRAESGLPPPGVTRRARGCW